VIKPIQDMTSWGSPGDPTTTMHSTLESTGREERWSASAHDVGRRTGPQSFELSVVCDAAEALRLQFDVLAPTYIAVHDVGGKTSRRLIAGLAAAMQSSVNRLTIKRQGYGNTLAQIEFTELPTWDERTRSTRPLRIYSTLAQGTDEQSQRAIVDVLIGRSRLGVVIVAADANAGSTAIALASLQEAMRSAQWTNRRLMLMPLKAMPSLAAQATQLAMGVKNVAVSMSPTVVRPVDAWNHVRSAWNLLVTTATDDDAPDMLPLEDPTSVTGRGGSLPTMRAAAVNDKEAIERRVEELRRLLNDAVERDAAASEKSSAARQIAQAQQAAAAKAAQAKHDAAARHAPPEQAPFLDAELTMPAAHIDGPEPAKDTVDSMPVDSMPVDTASHADGASVDANDRHVPHKAGTMRAPTTAAARTPMPGPARALDAQAVTSSLPRDSALASLLGQCAHLQGMIGCAIVDLASRTVVGHHRLKQTSQESIAGDSARLIAAMRAAALAFGLPGRVPDAALTYDEHHLMLRPIPTHDDLVFVAILDKEDGNVVVARLKMQRIEKAVFNLNSQPGALDTKIAALPETH
jgi:hypothetical protein